MHVRAVLPVVAIDKNYKITPFPLTVAANS